MHGRRVDQKPAPLFPNLCTANLSIHPTRYDPGRAVMELIAEAASTCPKGGSEGVHPVLRVRHEFGAEDVARVIRSQAIEHLVMRPASVYVLCHSRD